jgi:hypothetical protein
MKQVIVITGASSGFGALSSFPAPSLVARTTLRTPVLQRTKRVAEYEAGPYEGFADDVLKGFSSIVPPDANVEGIADAIVKVVDAPFGKRPFRVHYDPTQDGAAVVNMVLDRVRAELLRRIGLTDVLTPRDLTGQSKSAA